MSTAMNDPTQSRGERITIPQHDEDCVVKNLPWRDCDCDPVEVDYVPAADAEALAEALRFIADTVDGDRHAPPGAIWCADVARDALRKWEA